MGIVTKNAFKGYSYQEAIYRFFVMLMDIDSSITAIDAEVGSVGLSNFDDIKIMINGNEYFVQVKNIASGEPVYDEDNCCIKQGSSVTCIDSNQNSLYIFNSEINNFNSNSKFLDFETYKIKKCHVFNMSTDMMWDYILSNFAYQNRITFITRLIDSKISSGDFFIHRDYLPEQVFFSTSLQEETHKIRNFTLDNDKDCIVIVGKPGIGKSHLVNELQVLKSNIYRFWISEDDVNRTERLMYTSFIKDMSFKLFNDNKIHCEKDIITSLSSRNDYFFIDGLDHVENYNSGEMSLYWHFINELDSFNAKVCILTRPLKEKRFDNFSCVVVLSEWDKQETFEYCMFKGISDYRVQNKIYEIVNGYPILTRYIVEEYKLSGELPIINNVISVQEYYRQVINNTLDENILKVLCYFPVYFTGEEIHETCSLFSQSIIDFIYKRPYLFKSVLNRFYFFHDSFSNYLSNLDESCNNSSNKNSIQEFIENSILSNSPQFMSRLSQYKYLSDSFYDDVFDMYVDIKQFDKIQLDILDYESLALLYKFIRINLDKVSKDIITPEKLFDLTLINLILAKNNIDDNAFLYNLWKYFKVKNLDYTKVVYSSGNMFNAFSYFESRDIGRYILTDLYNSNGTEQASYDIDEVVEYEENFFSNYCVDKTEDIIGYLKINSSDFVNGKILSNLLVYIWKFDHCDHKLYNTINDYIYENRTYRVLQGELERYLFKLKSNDKFSVFGTLNEVKNIILELGLSNKNPYMNNSFKELCIAEAEHGSWEVLRVLTAKIRLAIHFNMTIAYKDLSLYTPMYYNRKDYTIYHLTDLLRLIIDTNDFQMIKESVRWIDKLQGMSEKGIRNLYGDFINLFVLKDLNTLRKIDGFNPDTHRLYVGYLETSTFDCLNEDEALKILLYSVRSTRNSIDKRDIINLLKSKHVKSIEESIRLIGINVEEGHNESKEAYQEEYKAGENFNKGYLNRKDSAYIIESKIPIHVLASMIDGNYCALPLPEIFDAYENELTEDKALDIIIQGLTAVGEFNILPSLDISLYSVPKILLKYSSLSVVSIIRSINIFMRILLVERSDYDE